MHSPLPLQAPPPQVDNLMDLLDLGGDDEQPAAPPTATAAATGKPACVPAAVRRMQQLPQVLPFEQSCGAGSCGVACDSSRGGLLLQLHHQTLSLWALFIGQSLSILLAATPPPVLLQYG